MADIKDISGHPDFRHRGGPPMDPNEARFQKIEQDLVFIAGEVKTMDARIDGRLNTIDVRIGGCVTRADLHQMETSIIKWLVGTTIAVAGLAFAIARFIG